MPNHDTPDPGRDQATVPNPITIVEEALARLSYGAIQLTVHDGRLVQVDVTERTRFTAKG